MSTRSAALIGLLCLSFALLSGASRVTPLARVEVLVPLLLAAHLAWAAAIGVRPRRSTVLGVSVVLVVLCILARPVAEDDYWRYLWDGYRTLVDGTPYGHAPELWFGDSTLPPSMQAVLDGINHPEVPTIYGPALQLLFAANHLLAPGEPAGLAVLFGALHLAGVALALRAFPAHRVALVAWNPLLLHQGVANLHPDLLLGWLLLAAAAAARQRAPMRVGALLAVAVATKVAALAAAPVLWLAAARSRAATACGMLRVAIAGAAVLMILYLPWVSPEGSEAAGLAAFAQDWRLNPALFAPLSAALGDDMARIVSAVATVAIACWLAIRARSRRAFGPVVLALAAMLALSPVVNAWYLAWLLPCAMLTRWRTPWAAGAALSLSMLTAGELGLAGDPFAIPAPIAALQWSIVIGALVLDLHAQRRRIRSRRQRTTAVMSAGVSGSSSVEAGTGTGTGRMGASLFDRSSPQAGAVRKPTTVDMAAHRHRAGFRSFDPACPLVACGVPKTGTRPPLD